ncbi:cytochrome P450 [Roseobacter ponti]|uniref:Cytochrome P450 n=1 Tax=Roseobacter ponti TaxID=1891787 RepID=A0A858STW1_9RHOB|nr:cytochrome P450 [Roseobacter ponti]QJF51447.1 cytochrome P450 [Roseobacter ponti]
MELLQQSPHDPAFVQNPYALYARVLAGDPVRFWEDFGMMAVFDAATIQALLRDRRLGRALPPGQNRPAPDHLRAFDALEQHSMLDLEPPRHTRLRGLVLRAFTSRRIRGLEPDIREISADLLSALPDDPFDLLPAFCTGLPVRVIARLLGVPEEMAPELLAWSNRMVAMYQAGRTRDTEEAANTAAAEFTAFLSAHIEERRHTPGNDLITELIAAEDDGAKLSRDEMISTCILLLNAGHEATVHTLGNAVKTLLENKTPRAALTDSHIAATVEEILRYDPPLHIFTRYAYEDVCVGGHTLRAGEEVALVLGSAGRDPARAARPDLFDPFRAPGPHAAFGGGLHFCVGAPLARLELQTGLRMLFEACPQLSLAAQPHYADTYHFHGLSSLMVTCGSRAGL